MSTLKELRGIAPRLPRTSRDDIRAAESELENVQHGYLTQRGWQRTCGGPGSLWLYEKEIDGKRWTGGTGLAICMQEAIDYKEPHRFEEHDEGDECALCGGERNDALHGVTPTTPQPDVKGER
jgi:hypothetical protein